MSLILRSLLVLFALSSAVVKADSPLDNVFNVDTVKDGKAVVEGNPKSLKVGDYLYFIHSPYRFKISAINGNKITVDVPAGSDLHDKNSLMREPNAVIKNHLETEQRLNSLDQ